MRGRNINLGTDNPSREWGTLFSQGNKRVMGTSERPHDGTPAIIVAALLGEYSLLLMPFIVTAMMQGYGLSEAAAGYLVSLQLIAMGAAAIAASYLVARIPPRRIVIVAAVAICIANAWCAFAVGIGQLASARGLTGLAEGSLMAAAGALAAGARNPHRLFSLLGFVVATVAAAALLLTPFLFAHLGVRGIFWLLAASPVAVLLAAPALPRAKPRAVDTPHFSAFAVKGAPSALIAFALLWIGAGALWFSRSASAPRRGSHSLKLAATLPSDRSWESPGQSSRLVSASAPACVPPLRADRQPWRWAGC